MKRFRIGLLGIIVLAVGSAFVTKGESKPYSNAFQQTSTCTAVTSSCNSTGALTCLQTNIYANQQSTSTCANILMHRNP
jgi:hypothetical protein